MPSWTECKAGHPLSGDNLYVSPGGQRHCRECARLRDRVRYPSRKTEQSATRKLWREKNKERSKEHSRNQFLRIKSSNPERLKEYSKRASCKAHGIDVERYDRMLLEQNNGCAICGSIPNKKRLGIDHDHTHCSGSYGCSQCIRGLLCDDCNQALGRFKDSVDFLQSAIKYLRRTQVSSFRQQKTTINDQKCLEDTLKGLGYKPSVSAEKQNVRGHYNENRKAEIILKKEDLKEGGDVGFNKTKDGNFEIVTDVYVMRNGFNLDKFTKKVTQAYAETKLRKQAASAGLTFLKKVELPNGGFRMQFVQA